MRLRFTSPPTRRNISMTSAANTKLIAYMRLAIIEFVDIELAYIRFDIANARFSW